MRDFVNYLRSESGASAAEYAMILAIIGTAMGIALVLLGSAIGASVSREANCISNTASCP